MNKIKYCNHYIVEDNLIGLWYYLSSKRQRRFDSGQVKYDRIGTYPCYFPPHPDDDIDIPF